MAVAGRAREAGAQLPNCKLKSGVVTGPIQPLSAGAQEGPEVMEKLGCAGFTAQIRSATGIDGALDLFLVRKTKR